MDFTTLLLLIGCLGIAYGDAAAEQLYNDLISGYNKISLPVEDNSKNLTIQLGASLIRIIYVDEKNQVLTTNVWLEMVWTDFNLAWQPKDYGGIKKMLIPSTDIWLPDVVLYNNAAGYPAISIYTDANVYYDGTVSWKPPAIYKSFCNIDVTYWPYDEQVCKMKFGLWTHSGNYVDLRYLDEEDFKQVIQEDGSEGLYLDKGMDLSYYYKSGSWDLMNVTGMRSEVVYEGCCGPISYVDITYKLRLRRKALFFTANLIVPCVLISFLAIFVFYLPADSNAKIGFGLSIMVTMCVFFLVLIDLVPPTSLVVPLFGKYLLFSNIFITFSVGASVIIVNIHCRGSDHKMPRWVRYLFLARLPRLLQLKPLDTDPDKDAGAMAEKATAKMHTQLADGKAGNAMFLNPPVTYDLRRNSPYFCRKDETVYDEEKRLYLRIFSGVISNIQFIMHHFKEIDEEDAAKVEWMHVAAVLDRLMLWIFTIVFFVGTLVIIVSAPAIYDFSPPLEIPFPTKPLGGDTRDLAKILAQFDEMNRNQL